MLRRRILILALLAAMLTAACGGPAARETEIPRLEGTLPRTTTTTVAPTAQECRLAVGTGLGAEVVRLSDGSPAEGLIEPGDVVVGFDEMPVATAADLITAVRESEVGAQPRLSVVRGSESLTIEITVAESPTTPGRPIIGVEVTTSVDLIGFDDAVVDTVPSGPLARIVHFADSGAVFALDPLAGTWSQVLPAAPPPPWTPLGDRLISLVDDGGEARLVDVLDEREVIVDTRQWGVRWLLGSIDAALLAVADRGRGPDNDLSSLESALLAIDPVTGDILWEWLPGSHDGEALIPLIAFVDPAQDRVLVGLGPAEQTNEDFDYVILDASGRERSPWPPSTDDFVPENGLILGWYDSSDLMFITDRQTGLFRYTPGDTGYEEVTLPVSASPSRIWPLGDGKHIILQTPTEMMVVAADGSPFARRLTEGCVAEAVVGTGWGAVS